jgi:hypothetical protein
MLGGGTAERSTLRPAIYPGSPFSAQGTGLMSAASSWCISTHRFSSYRTNKPHKAAIRFNVVGLPDLPLSELMFRTPNTVISAHTFTTILPGAITPSNVTFCYTTTFYHKAP